MESLFGFINFLPVTGKDSFSEMYKDIAVSYSKVTKGCMLEAANQVHSGADDNLLCDIAVSCNGTQQKRRVSSLVGAVAVISVDTGKFLDYKVMSKNAHFARCGRVVKVKMPTRNVLMLFVTRMSVPSIMMARLARWKRNVWQNVFFLSREVQPPVH